MSEQRDNNWILWLAVIVALVVLFIHVKMDHAWVLDLQRRIAVLEQQHR